MARRSLWRRVRRATRGPRNAALARAIAGVTRMFGLLPLRVGLALGRVLGSAAHALLGTPRRLALRHVALAFPALDADARQVLVRDTFRHAGVSFVELAAFQQIMQRPGYVRMEGEEILRAGLAQGRGLVAATGHCGNWELLAAWSAAVGLPLTVVVRRVYDMRFHHLILRFRAAAGIEVLVRDDPHFVRAVGEALQRNRIVAMLIDQDIQGASVYVPFFGRPAHTPVGAALLALRARVPLATVFIEREPDGRHLARVTAVPNDVRRHRDGVHELTARLTAAIEAQIRRAPEQWVWWHQRWRRQPQRALSVTSAIGEHAIS
jgi:Kdo2-lipid IVA lauroyltransferase/acyltransferase